MNSKIVFGATAAGNTGLMQTGSRPASVTLTFGGTNYAGTITVEAGSVSSSLSTVWTSVQTDLDTTVTYTATPAMKWYKVSWTLTGGTLNAWMETQTGDSVGTTLPGLIGEAGKVLAVNGTETDVDWVDAVPYNSTTKAVDISPGKLTAGSITLSGLGAPGGITVVPTLTQEATITVVGGSDLVEGDYFTINYGAGTIPIEFDELPGDGTSGGRIPYVFDPLLDADAIRDGLITLINAAAPTYVTASIGGAATIAIVLDTPGATGGSNTENVTNAGFLVTGFADPTAATTYTYRLVARRADGTTTEAGTESTTGTGHATLSAANFNRLSWSAVTGAVSYDVYRTAGGATQGKIVSATTALTVDDTGLAASGAAPTVDTTGRLTADGFTMPTGAVNNYVLTSDASGNASWAAGGGISGLTTNYLTKAASATTIGNTAIVEASAGALATTAGTALGLTATAPAATTGASQAGVAVTLTASAAVASTDTNGAAAGGSITLTGGDAARRVSGDGNGGDVVVIGGAKIGNGRAGAFRTATIHAPTSTNLTLSANPYPDAGGNVNIECGNVGYVKFVGYGTTGVQWSQASKVLSFGASLIGFTASGTAGSGDLTGDDIFLRRRGAANPAWGAAAASPVAYTHNLAADARSGTDTNTAGANATLLPGIGTGTGAASRLLLGGPILGSTGSAAQTTATPVSIGGEVKADGTESFLNVTGTLPASPSGTVAAVNVATTGSGSAAQDNYSLRASMAAGYTGASANAAVKAYSEAAGSAATSNFNANHGVHAEARGNTTGKDIAVGGYAYNPNGSGSAFGVSGSGNSGTNAIGVVGHAYNATYNIGGFFHLAASSWAAPTVGTSSAALISDNAAVAAPIFLARDNGTTVFSVNDGGGVNAMYEVEANTAGVGSPNILLATESRSVMTNEGATALNYHTLPTAAKGLTFTFYCADGDGIRVVANTGDDIRVAGNVSAAAGYCESTSIGSSVTLLAINADSWVAIASVGSWTVV